MLFFLQPSSAPLFRIQMVVPPNVPAGDQAVTSKLAKLAATPDSNSHRAFLNSMHVALKDSGILARTLIDLCNIPLALLHAPPNASSKSNCNSQAPDSVMKLAKVFSASELSWPLPNSIKTGDSALPRPRTVLNARTSTLASFVTRNPDLCEPLPNDRQITRMFTTWRLASLL